MKRCEACKAERPENKIDSLKKDVSRSWGVKQGTVFMYFDYCNDTPRCLQLILR